MNFDRRSFLKAGSFVACASALVPAWAAAALPKTTRVLDAALPLDPAVLAVLKFAASYSGDARLVGAGVFAAVRGMRPHGVRVLVEAADLARFETALAGLPFSGAYAQANGLSFTLDGIEFTLENLLPASFAQALAQLYASKHTAFAHDALSYQPATRQLSDPFAAAKGAVLKLVNRTLAGAPALDAALRGIVDAQDLGLTQGADFAAWLRRVLQMLTRDSAAGVTAETFLRQLATLADRVPPAQMQSILRSRAVATALHKVFGIDVPGVIAQFDRLRVSTGAGVSNAALWLALLLAPEVGSESEDGAATTWIERGTRFQVLRSRRALAGARELVAAGSF